MTPEAKKNLMRFLWQLFSALLAALGGTQAASAAVAAGWLG